MSLFTNPPCGDFRQRTWFIGRGKQTTGKRHSVSFLSIVVGSDPRPREISGKTARAKKIPERGDVVRSLVLLSEVDLSEPCGLQDKGVVPLCVRDG